ncbi:kinase-like domain-containing protein [Mycena latifolia]|nr:kinase-like domain-containing protein [Mycena latifolia]
MYEPYFGNTIPAVFAHSLTLKKSERTMDELKEILGCKQDVLHSLISYSSVVDSLLTFLKQSYQAKEWKDSHIISKTVHEHMNRDISFLVVQLVLFLRDQESYQRLLACCETDAQRLLDLLQDLLDYDGFFAVRPLLFKALLRLSRASGLHPTCLPLSGLQKVGHQVAAGGFGDIWRGLVRGQSVSVKIMRLFQESDVEAMLKEFGEEAVIWRQLCHPNLLPFFGLYYLENRLCLVSPWMENGNILDFFRKNTHGIDRLSLILDVALGLKYLHENRVIHGDLKAINILVTPSRRACITDFGLSSIADAMTLRFTHTTPSNTRGGTARYQAPELFRGDSKSHFGSDVYAFACVCYEILTGKVPFHDVPNEMAVMFKVVEGERPSRPPSCSGTTAFDSLWDLLGDCWAGKPSMRPTASAIVDQLEGPLTRAKTTHSASDWDETFSSKCRRSMQVQPLLPSVTQIERLLFGDDVVQACTECFPDQISSQPTSKNGELERQPKRPLEAATSDADEDMSPIRPWAKKMKTSEGTSQPTSKNGELERQPSAH